MFVSVCVGCKRKKTDNSYENVQVWRQASGEVDGLKLGYWANGQSQSATTEAH